jgi:hypothetical protein
LTPLPVLLHCECHPRTQQKEDDVETEGRSIQVSARFYCADGDAAVIEDGAREGLSLRPGATAVMQSRRTIGAYDEHDKVERLLTIRFTGQEDDGDEVADGLMDALGGTGLGGTVRVSAQKTTYAGAASEDWA